MLVFFTNLPFAQEATIPDWTIASRLLKIKIVFISLQLFELKNAERYFIKTKGQILIYIRNIPKIITVSYFTIEIFGESVVFM